MRRREMRRRFALVAGIAAVLLAVPAAPAWAFGGPSPNICTYDQGSLKLTVAIRNGSSVRLVRAGDDLTVTDIDQTYGPYVCVDYALEESGTYAIGDAEGEIRTVEVVGDAGPGLKFVTFEDAVSTVWGANSPSNLYRSVTGVGLIWLDGTSDADVITASTFAAFDLTTSLYIDGGEGNDSLTAANGVDTLEGGDGNDILRAGGGDDFLDGGLGDDSLLGYSGNDMAVYDHVTTPIDVDLTSGKGSGVDIGNDTYNSIEVVDGGSGNDVLKGSAYADWLYGNDGDDILRGRGGNDELVGGLGTDTATYSEQTYPVSVTLGATSSGAAGNDSLQGIENLIGGSAGDTLVGNAFANSLDGGAGADTLVGMGDDDVLTGGTGLDTVSYDNVAFTGAATGGVTASLAAGAASGGAGADTILGVENLTGSYFGDTLTGSSGVNVINGRGGEDTVYADGGNDTVNGDGDNDTLYGEAGADTLRGGFGDDTLYGGAGADPLWGDVGNDTLCGGLDGDTLRGGDDNDTLVGGFVGTGGAGIDLMYGDGGTGDTISYDNTLCGGGAESGAITFKLGAVGTQQNTGGAGYDVNGGGVENLTGGSAGDTLVGDGNDNVIRGLGGNDTIQGGVGDDTMYSGAGSNKVDGQLGTNDRCIIDSGGSWASYKNCDAFI